MSTKKDEPVANYSLDQFGILFSWWIVTLVEMPPPFTSPDKQFYHHYRTSNELCSAGLFTVDSETPTKKHRRMKCWFEMQFFLTK